MAEMLSTSSTRGQKPSQKWCKDVRVRLAGRTDAAFNRDCSICNHEHMEVRKHSGTMEEPKTMWRGKGRHGGILDI